MRLGSDRPVRLENGSSAVEYGLLISVIALVIVATITIFGERVFDLYANVF